MNAAAANRRLLWGLAACALSMVGLAYASVPLYRLFCSVTGFGGTTQRVSPAEAAAAGSGERWVSLSFDGNVAPGLAWDFAPEVKSLRVRLGEIVTVTYRARNRGDSPATGTAVFNVQPDKVGPYFDKIECFCFTAQPLAPGESAVLPVQFYVDPAMAGDAAADDVRNVTLSYTFFRAKER